MKKVLVVVLGVVLAVWGWLVGGLLACASFFLFWFIAANPDGNGSLSSEEWMIVLLLASMSILSLVLPSVAAGFLVRYAVK